MIVLLAAGSLFSGKLVASDNKNSNGKNGDKKDTLTVKCLLSSANSFYAAELGEEPLRYTVDSLANYIKYDTTQKLHLVVVSLSELGLQNLADVQWDELLDSAISHGYMPCPAQVGPELYLLSQCKQLNNIPSGVPVFLGMEQITRSMHHKFNGFASKKEEGFVFCLKSKKHGSGFKLGYSSTLSAGKNCIWSADDKFLFVSK